MVFGNTLLTDASNLIIRKDVIIHHCKRGNLLIKIFGNDAYMLWFVCLLCITNVAYPVYKSSNLRTFHQFIPITVTVHCHGI